MHNVQHWTKGLFVSWTGQNRKHLASQNSAQLILYELFIARPFHFIFFDHNLLEMSKTAEGETACEKKQLQLVCWFRVVANNKIHYQALCMWLT